jgi:hypothetical protein
MLPELPDPDRLHSPMVALDVLHSA